MTWNDVRQEVNRTHQQGTASAADIVRRGKIVAAERISGTPLIVYAADFSNEDRAVQYGAGVQIELDDKTGFLQALSDIQNGPLDVVLHSPGGSATATESIVNLLRSRFDPIRFIVPHTAKSAATMLALSGDEVLLGEVGELGPIDPQFRIQQDQRVVTVPAGAAIDQFSRIHKEISENPQALAGWLPIIRQYGPSFLQECHNQVSLSQELVANWLKSYMFKDEPDAETRATRVAEWLATHDNFKTHSRAVGRDQLLEIDPNLKIRTLAAVSEDFCAAIMAVYWSIQVTFEGTTAFKIIEHASADAAYIRLQQQLQGVLQPMPQPSPPGRPSGMKNPTQQKNPRKRSRTKR